jgi:hypothetical protein
MCCLEPLLRRHVHSCRDLSKDGHDFAPMRHRRAIAERFVDPHLMMKREPTSDAGMRFATVGVSPRRIIRLCLRKRHSRGIQRLRCRWEPR